jgi:DNA polymerase III alpha subunit
MTEERIRKVFVKDLKGHEQVHSVFKATKKERLQTRAGKPYLALSLTDKTGNVDARVFDNVDAAEGAFASSDYLLVKAKVGHFHGKPQLVIEQLERLDAGPIDGAEFEFVAPPEEKTMKPSGKKEHPDTREKPSAEARLRPRLNKMLEHPEVAVALESLLKHVERIVDERIAFKLEGRGADVTPRQDRPRRERNVKSEARVVVEQKPDASLQRDSTLPEGLAFKPLTQLVDETVKS